MKIALSGYGKMGRMIESAAQSAGHTIVLKADIGAEGAVRVGSAAELAEAVKKSGADGVIDFTHPASVVENILALTHLGLPIVVGTTGWYDKLEEVRRAAQTGGACVFYSANYSIGVNLFYRIAEYAARLTAAYSEYDTAVSETHHRRKADSPSGTALDLAKAVMRGNPHKKETVFNAQDIKDDRLYVASLRVGSVPGTHRVYFDSPADTIELTHCARSREGFACGAVRAFEWLAGGLANGSLKKGALYTMDDMLVD
ncbi:4-hydroxy-tetrahydrodipicolinate reductase [Treponema sp. OMZ 840]|uniref:4-hydroxy-tetrahydrodipicolinate reductase n=1 Tax=Treponema sp. OMZ 840 TaxID=244313 RepID=UPI003D946DF9